MTEQDPFLAVMGFLEGKGKGLDRWGARLDAAFETLQSNLYMTVYLVACLLLLLLLSSPFLIASGIRGLVNLGAFMHVSAGFLMMCHQLPDRSFIFDGIPFPVCARDVGIYVGAASGFATVFLEKKPKLLSSIKLVALATVPIALDGITQTILVMRESNNALRLITGLAFGFGIAAYAANRILLWRRPLFRQQVWTSRLAAADLVVALLLIWLLLSATREVMPGDYMRGQDAVALALADYGSRPYAEAKPYMVSSFTPLTIQMDPYYPSHRDNILDDVRASDWAKQRLASFLSSKVPDYMTENMTLGELLQASAEKEHKYGIWAVPVLTEKPVKGSAPYLSEGSGTYYYYDPLTGKLIMKTTH